MIDSRETEDCSMRKRCLSIFLVLALCLAYLPVPVHAATVNVSSYGSFADAVGDAGDGGTVVIDEANYETDIGVMTGTSGESYTIDLNGQSFTVTTGTGFLTDSNWTIIDSVGGGSFTADSISLNAGLANDDPQFSVGGSSQGFSFKVAGTISIPSMTNGRGTLSFGEGAAVEIGSISSSGYETDVSFERVSGSVGGITLNGNSLQGVWIGYVDENAPLSIGDLTISTAGKADLYITQCRGLSFTRIDISSTAVNSIMTVLTSAVTTDNLVWNCPHSVEVSAGSTLTVTTLADMGHGGDNTVAPFFFDDDASKVVITEDHVQSSVDTTWFADYLENYSVGHIHAADNGGMIEVTNEANPDGSARPVDKIVLKNPSAFEQAHFSAVDPDAPFSDASLEAVFTAKPYNGGAQYLFPEEEAEDIGGTVWYNLDSTDPSGWTTTPPQRTDAGTFPNAAYLIRGDAEHNDSDQLYDNRTDPVGVGIAPLAVAVTVTGHTETATYDGAAKTVTGYDVTSDNAVFDAASDPYSYTGPDTTITQTDAGSYTMGLTAAYFSGSNMNFSPTFDVTDGSLTIDPRPVEVAADDQNVLAGDPMPALTARVIGAVDGEEDLIAYTVSTTAADTNTEGTYPITPAGDAAQGNYAVTYTDGLLTVGALPPAAWTAEPAAADGLIYSGTAQELVTAGTVPAGCAALYSPDGVTYDTAIPAGTDAGSYTVYYKIRGDGVNYWDSASSGPLNVTIAAKEVTVTADNKTKIHGEDDPELTAAVEGLVGTDTVVYTLSRETGEAVGEYIITPAGDEEQGNYRVTGFHTGTLTIESRNSGSPAPKQETYDFEQPEEGVGSGVEEEDAWTWGERANLPEDVATLYQVLANNAVSEEEEAPLPYPGLGSEHFLASDDVWTLPSDDRPGRSYQVVNVMVCEDHEPLYFANGDGKMDENSFGKSDFYVVNAGSGDSKIDYPNLKIGDVVRTKTFNGVFVTKLQKSNNPAFDADLDRLKSDTFASFRAFELDHPEVFWLTGDIKIRSMTVTVNGVQTAYLFLVLADDTGFTMRISDYSAPGAIEAAIARRDAAVAEIIAQIPAGASVREKIANLNKWFTLHNEYNRSADLNSIGFTPHRSLKSLVGSEGVDGPVCDGYSRGFKTVCDRLGIPVILDTGVASRGSHSEYHMWMRVQVDGIWYGMDCTWNDPVMEGVNGKISGYENEQYMLVGDDTVVDGQKFGVSHPVNKTAGGTTGVLFASLMVNAGEIDGYLPLDFEDVRLADWFYDFVKSAANKGLMGGVADRVFSPQTTATRGQIVQILYNAAGQPAVNEVKVDGWFGKAATWAMERGIVAGYPDGGFHGNDPVTREQLATILWAYEGAPAQEGTPDFADSGEISTYAADALLWAQTRGIIGGKPGNLADPQGTATRAEIATIFSNYLK